MLNRFFSFILLLLIIASAGRDGLEIIAFNIHREAITQRLCINLNKPEKRCNGKCALKAQLEKQQEQKQSPANPIPEPDSKVIFTLNESFIDDPREAFNYAELTDNWLIPTSRLIVADLAHPPELLV